MLLALLAAACFTVPGPTITAGDLAQAVPQFKPEDPAAVVAYAPNPGVDRTFHGAELRQALERLHYTTPDPLADVCFHRTVAVLRPEDVVAAMKQSLGESAHIRILEVSGFPAPAGQLVFPREQLAAPPVQIWRGYVSYDSAKRFPVWARVDVSVSIIHAVALEQLKPGIPIQARQINFEQTEGFPELRATPQSARSIEGYLPRRYVPANATVWNDAIDPPDDVTKGDRVLVIVHSGHAQLNLDAEAVASGRRGDVISFKNPESGKLFRARVQGPGRAGLETSPLQP